MADRHALQFKGQVKSFSSKDIVAQLAAAQQQGQHQAVAQPPPDALEGQLAPRAVAVARPQLPDGRPAGFAIASPTAAESTAGNFHALQYKGAVKKFTSGAILDQFSRAAQGAEIGVPSLSQPAPPVDIAPLIDFDSPHEEAPVVAATAAQPVGVVSQNDDWADFLAQPQLQPPAQPTLLVESAQAQPPPVAAAFVIPTLAPPPHVGDATLGL